MGVFFFILGALFNTRPPVSGASHASSSSIGMAVMIYLYGASDFYIYIYI
jgi:hypothetical protein